MCVCGGGGVVVGTNFLQFGHLGESGFEGVDLLHERLFLRLQSSPPLALDAHVRLQRGTETNTQTLSKLTKQLKGL